MSQIDSQRMPDLISDRIRPQKALLTLQNFRQVNRNTYRRMCFPFPVDAFETIYIHAIFRSMGVYYAVFQTTAFLFLLSHFDLRCLIRTYHIIIKIRACYGKPPLSWSPVCRARQYKLIIPELSNCRARRCPLLAGRINLDSAGLLGFS